MKICQKCYFYDRCSIFGWADAEKCFNFDPRIVRTQYDKIKAMNIDEMADMFAGMTITGACNDFGIKVDRKCDSKCKECIKIWLESEVTKQ